MQVPFKLLEVLTVEVPLGVTPAGELERLVAPVVFTATVAAAQALAVRLRLAPPVCDVADQHKQQEANQQTYPHATATSGHRVLSHHDKLTLLL
jgi:hypothetical protein